MSEQELRKKWQDAARAVKTKEDFDALFVEILAHKHDYGSIVVGIGALTVAAAWLMERQPCGGITGFQAGAVMWEFICGWDKTSNKCGLRLLDYDDLCYPQMAHKFTAISRSALDAARAECARLLAEKPERGVPEVREHWRRIVDGEVPFGLTVEAR